MNPVYSAPDIAKIRSRYRAKDTIYFDPCVVVFQAQVSSVPSAADGTYLQISFDTVTIGAWSDIKIGQMVLISTTSTHTDYLYEMRVAAAATSSVLPVNESAYTLEENYYITIVDTYKPLPRVRAGSLVDGRLAYQGLPAAINGLPSAMLVESAIEGVFNISVAIQTFTGITVSSTLFEIPDVVYLTGTSADLVIEIEMPADSHTWGRFTYTLSTGVTGFMVFQLIVQDPDNPTLATQSIDQLRLNRAWRGHHATCTAYRGVGVTQVMNGTRAVLVSRRQFDGGTLSGPMDNVAFVGYLSKEQNSTQSINDKSVSFDLVGIWERAGQLPFNPIAVRDVASPAKWDEINLPTAQRVVTHVLARYSTILNLCSLNLDLTDTTWYGGDMDVNATSLGDAIEQVLSEMNAAIVQNPSGELFLRRDLRYEDDDTRDDADIVWTLTNADLRNLDVSFRHDEQTGRIIIGFRGYQTSRVPSKGGKAVSPAVTLGTSPETKPRNNQLMHANLTDTQLIAEAEQRAGNILAVENPLFEMSLSVMPYLSWLNTSVAQWIVLSLLAAINTRGRAFSNRTLLESLELSYNNTVGSHDLTITLLPETQGGAALVVAALTRNVSSLSMFYLPPLGAYGGSYGGPSTLNTTDDAAPRFNRQNMGGMGVPVPPDQAYDEGQYSPEGGKKKFAISFANPSNVAAGFTSVNTETYNVTVSGSAQVASDAWIHTIDLVNTLGGYAIVPPFGTHTPGTGVTPGDGVVGGPAGIRSVYIIDTIPSSTITGVTLTFNLTKGTYDAVTPVAVIYLNGVIVASVNPADITNGTGKTISYVVSTPSVTDIQTQVVTSYDNALAYTYSGATTLTQLVISGTGTNPYTSDPGTPLYADAFYQWELDDEGEETNISLLGALAGLFIDSATATAVPPPYSPTHEYTFEWTGTGNNPSFKFQDAIYSDNANLPLYITIEGPGADS